MSDAAGSGETIPFDEFLKIDIRIGTVVACDPFPEARKPAYKLAIDFGPEIGVKKSSAQITTLYEPEQVVGRQVARAQQNRLAVSREQPQPHQLMGHLRTHQTGQCLAPGIERNGIPHRPTQTQHRHRARQQIGVSVLLGRIQLTGVSHGD